MSCKSIYNSYIKSEVKLKMKKSIKINESRKNKERKEIKESNANSEQRLKEL